MIHNIPQPEISPEFTVDDIHRIREWNYEKLRDATQEERAEYYRNSSNEFTARIEAIRPVGVV